jgi:Asp-tRNA(Asn)/Glu-tRNA(Gln) amidotransferase A subunit family amidase
MAALLLAAVGADVAQAAAPPPFEVEEASIAEIHAAMKVGALTCRDLVNDYIRRIEAYDKNGPGVNAIVTINPQARAEAEVLDKRFVATGFVGPLHCAPLIVKDNFETEGLQTTDGALVFKGYLPHQDATQVARLRAAGAIVLAKSNMAEWAFSPVETVSSILPGYTKNVYALDRVTAGSSGGTASAVAASFGAVGLGSDTGDSIRGPSSHLALAGIRSTMGLTSRAGVFPLSRPHGSERRGHDQSVSGDCGRGSARSRHRRRSRPPHPRLFAVARSKRAEGCQDRRLA